MNVNDPIADMLTRIRNAIQAKRKVVLIPSSKMKQSIAEILKTYGYIKDYSITEDNKQNVLNISLKYINGVSAIKGLKKKSTPGLHVYSGVNDIPRVVNGMGMAILSTSKGLLTNKQAKKDNVGGELICYIW